MDDAFNNRIEVEEMADDKMSYYSAQEMGKAGQVEMGKAGQGRTSHLSTDVLIGDRWILFTAMVSFSSVLQDSEMYFATG